MTTKRNIGDRDRETYEVWRADEAGHFFLVFTPCKDDDNETYTQRESYATFAKAEARRTKLDGTDGHRGTHHVVKVTTTYELASEERVSS